MEIEFCPNLLLILDHQLKWILTGVKSADSLIPLMWGEFRGYKGKFPMGIFRRSPSVSGVVLWKNVTKTSMRILGFVSHWRRKFRFLELRKLLLLLRTWPLCESFVFE